MKGKKGQGCGLLALPLLPRTTAALLAAVVRCHVEL